MLARAMRRRLRTCIELGARLVGAHVGAALLLGHAHAHRHRALLLGRDEARVVGGGSELGRPHPCNRGVGAHGRRDGIAHRRGAQHRRFELGEEHEAGGALNTRQRCARPRRAVQPKLQFRAEQRVIARMKPDLVDAAALHVVRAQLRWVRVGQTRVLQHLGTAGERAECAQARGVERRRMALQRGSKRRVAIEQIRTDPRRGLIEHVLRAHRALLSISTCGMPSSR